MALTSLTTASWNFRALPPPLQSSEDTTRTAACAQGADILCEAAGRAFLPRGCTRSS